MREPRHLSFFVAAIALLVAPLGRLPAQTPASPTEVEITASDNMQYDLTHLEVKPGETIKLTLKNVGTLPKTSMAHNWVLLKQGVDPMAFVNAAAKAKGADYIPAADSADVVAHTKLLGPGEADTITFTAPATPGQYVYLCSFPAHYMLGMKGVLNVQ